MRLRLLWVMAFGVMVLFGPVGHSAAAAARLLQDELNRQSQALLEGLPPEEQETVLRSLTWFAERLADERLWVALPTPNDSAH